MARSDALLRAVACILPREFRERVFEPALADLQLEESAGRGGRPARWAARAILIGESLRLGIPHLVWRRGRPTRLAAVGFVVICLAALAIQRLTYAERPVADAAYRTR